MTNNTGITPAGFQVLLEVVDVPEKTSGGIILADETKDIQKHAASVCKVIALGPDAYKNEHKFPSGPYCSEGDFILLNKYSGKICKTAGKDLRLINDDEVCGTVESPTSYFE